MAAWSFVQSDLPYGELCTAEDYLRAAHKAIRVGADCVYCAASVETVRTLAAEGIPVVGHVGLVPSRATWTGGFKAVGKTVSGCVKERDSGGKPRFCQNRALSLLQGSCCPCRPRRLCRGPCRMLLGHRDGNRNPYTGPQNRRFHFHVNRLNAKCPYEVPTNGGARNA